MGRAAWGNTGVTVEPTSNRRRRARQYPFTAQLIHLHADDPRQRMGGLIIDAKGNYVDFVRDQCAHAGRLADYSEVSPTSGVRWNIVGRPDLNATALGADIEGLGYSLDLEARVWVSFTYRGSSLARLLC